MERLLITNATIVTMNNKRDVFKGDILVEDNRITRVDQKIEVKAEEVIDARGKVVIPGLTQTHIHLTQTLFRGQADDLELLDWLKKRVWPLEAAHTAESNRISAQLGIAELIKGGTTAIIDMGTVNHTEEIFDAVDKSGFRAIMGKCMMDYDVSGVNPLMEGTKKSIDESMELLEKWHMKDGGRIQYAFAPRFVISCSEKLLLETKRLANEYDVMIHTHASENQSEIRIVQEDRGMRNIVYLDKLGLTGENLILAHCIWLDEEEMKIIAATGTKVAHCPNSNLKLASGIAKIPELISMNANISLAADGAPCNNNLDMFSEMRTAALIQKGRLLNPTVMPAEKVFELATLGGARAMRMEGKLGSIEEGKLADIVIIDLNSVHCVPNDENNIVSKLVYSAKASDVETTIINGKIVMDKRKIKTLNENEIKKEANRIIKNQVDRAMRY
ncbi:MAG: 5'-deoxyadenosine deaminase [Clostridiales bacterium]|nr:5'-deoxyadenosine deaminase [Clostridiales bacterium]